MVKTPNDRGHDMDARHSSSRRGRGAAQGGIGVHACQILNADFEGSIPPQEPDRCDIVVHARHDPLISGSYDGRTGAGRYDPILGQPGADHYDGNN